MITIHSTKKLLAKLPVNAEGTLPLPPKSLFLDTRETGTDSLLGSWHANLLTIQRRNCVLFVHDTTRFPLFIPALTKPDFANLDWWFGDALMNTLLKCAANNEQLDKAWAAIQRLRFDSHTDRSVQGTMNQMAQEAEHYLYHDGINVAEITGNRLSAWLADRPCGIKGQKEWVWPNQAFLTLLDRLPSPSVSDVVDLPENVVVLDRFRNRP